MVMTRTIAGGKAKWGLDNRAVDIMQIGMNHLIYIGLTEVALLGDTGILGMPSPQ